MLAEIWSGKQYLFKIRRKIELYLERVRCFCRNAPRRGASRHDVQFGGNGPVLEDEGLRVRLVVADDDAAIRRAVRMFIEWQCPDFVVVGEAADGRAALELVQEHDADVVLMDVRMPVLDGLSAARALKGELRHRAAVVLMTSLTLPKIDEESARAGAAALLRKPFSLAELAAVLRRAVDKPAGALGRAAAVSHPA